MSRLEQQFHLTPYHRIYKPRPKTSAALLEEHRQAGYVAKNKPTIFDRHPIVSEMCYSRGRLPDHEAWVHHVAKLSDLWREFIHAHNPIIVVCLTPLGPHEVKDHDTDEHLEMLREYKQWISNFYHLFSISCGAFRYYGNAIKLIQDLNEVP